LEYGCVYFINKNYGLTGLTCLSLPTLVTWYHDGVRRLSTLDSGLYSEKQREQL